MSNFFITVKVPEKYLQILSLTMGCLGVKKVENQQFISYNFWGDLCILLQSTVVVFKV